MGRCKFSSPCSAAEADSRLLDGHKESVGTTVSWIISDNMAVTKAIIVRKPFFFNERVAPIGSHLPGSGHDLFGLFFESFSRL